MDKDSVKEIFLLVIDIIVAVCEILWTRIKGGFQRFWDVFFRIADVSSREPAAEQKVWGNTGDDTWPSTPEEPREINQEQAPQVKEAKTETSLFSPPIRIQTPAPPPSSIPELPDGYGDNRIVIMVRDPIWLFAYWEIRKEVFDRVMNTLGALTNRTKAVIRVYDVTDIVFNGNNAHHRFDVDVTLEAKNWYIHAGLPDRVLCVEIGMLTANGTFRILARSNTVRTPRADVSDIVDEKWVCIESLYKKAYEPMDLSLSEFVFKRAEGQSPDESGADMPLSGTVSSPAVLKT